MMLSFYKQLRPRIAGYFSYQIFTALMCAADLGCAQPYLREEVAQ